MITTRRATTDDISGILCELKSFADFYGTKKSLFGEENYSFEFIKKIVLDHFCYVAVTDSNEVVGLIAGLISSHLFNPEIKTLTELFWWVREEHRNNRAGLELLNHFVEFGKANADWITFTLEHHSPVNDNCLLKRGFKQQERNYLMEVC